MAFLAIAAFQANGQTCASHIGKPIAADYLLAWRIAIIRTIQAQRPKKGVLPCP
jgi:hypothetical protein